MVGGVGFILGAIACLVVAVIEFGAWALVAPPRSMNVDDQAADDSTLNAQTQAELIEMRAADGSRLVGRWLPVPAAITTGRTALSTPWIRRSFFRPGGAPRCGLE